MPAYSHLRTFITAVKTGKTHITDCLDAHFADLARVRADPNFPDFSTGNWSGGAPAWLGRWLDSIGLTSEERDHILRYPAAELERTRAAASAAVAADQSPTFFWTLYDGTVPRADTRTGVNGNPEIHFQSPGGSLRLTTINFGEIYVEEV